MWKNGQNETEHSTWMLLLTGKTVHLWWNELSVTPSGQKTKQSKVTSDSHCSGEVRYSGGVDWLNVVDGGQ